MRKLFPSILLVLALDLLVCAQTANTPSFSPVIKTENGAEVLAHARELYTSEGPKTALPEFEKALAQFRKDGDQKDEAITIGWIGNCYKRFGDFPQAEKFLQRALSMKRSIGDRSEEGKTLSHLGLLHK